MSVVKVTTTYLLLHWHVQQRTLGHTQLKTSRIGLGLAALGRPGYINLGHQQDLQGSIANLMELQAHQVLSEAYHVGICYFDVARSYGKAESFLGNWLDTHKPNNVLIASKWGYIYTANWQIEADKHEIKEHTRENLERQFIETTQNLNQLNLYQIHSATLESGVLDNHKILDKLLEIKQTGIYIGLSVSGVGQSATLEKALRIERHGQRLFDTVQATYNLLETSAETLLRLAHQEGMGIIIKEALANGRLTERNTKTNFIDKMLRLNNYADHYGASLDAFAIAFILQQPWVDVVLSGAATVEHVRSNVKALDIAPLLDIEDFSQDSETYWRERSNLQWN